MSLSEFLAEQKTIFLDGAMGTQLADLGLEMGGQNNLTNPKEVLSIHRQYVDCGCRIITTNTLTMNRISIQSQKLNVSVKDVNLAGVKLAKQAAGKDCYVLGDMSSTGKLLKPYGEYLESEFYEVFKEQAQFLAEGGVDGFIVETIMDLREALCALSACKDVSNLPVITSMAFVTTQKGGRTIMGNSAEECAKELAKGGAQVIGANCGGLSPSETAEIVSLFRGATSLPILAQPNAGKPKLVKGRTVFDMTPEEFADGIAECLNAGARLVGGCCGTSPAHIRKVANILTEL